MLLALATVVLLIVAFARLASLSATAAVAAYQDAVGLQHRLAAESVVQDFAAAIDGETDIAKQFFRNGEVIVRVKLDSAQAVADVRSDAAKLDVAAFQRPDQRRLLDRNLRHLQAAFDLSPVDIEPKPIDAGDETGRAYAWFDQLFAEDPTGGLMIALVPEETMVPEISSGPRKELQVRCWTDAVTVFGDGRVDVRFAPDEILRLALRDVDRAAASRIIRQRNSVSAGQTDSTGRLLAGVGSDGNVGERLTARSTRYAFHIRTTVQHSGRSWYAVAELGGGRVVKWHYLGVIQP